MKCTSPRSSLRILGSAIAAWTLAASFPVLARSRVDAQEPGGKPAPATARLDIKEATLREALSKLEEAFGLRYTALDGVLDGAKPVTLAGEFTREEALVQVARQAGVRAVIGEDGVASIGRPQTPSPGAAPAGLTNWREKAGLEVSQASLAGALEKLKEVFGANSVVRPEAATGQARVTLAGRYTLDEAAQEIAAQAGVGVNLSSDCVRVLGVRPGSIQVQYFRGDSQWQAISPQARIFRTRDGAQEAATLDDLADGAWARIGQHMEGPGGPAGRDDRADPFAAPPGPATPDLRRDADMPGIPDPDRRRRNPPEEYRLQPDRRPAGPVTWVVDSVGILDAEAAPTLTVQASPRAMPPDIQYPQGGDRYPLHGGPRGDPRFEARERLERIHEDDGRTK